WPQSRGACAFALLYPAFYLVYGLLLGRGVEAWYLILPASLGVVAAAAALSEAALRLRVPAARVAGLAVLLLLAAPAVVPGLAVAHPGGQTPPTLAMLREEGGGPGELEQAVAVLEGKDWNGVFLVDVGWFYTAYPFSERAAAVGVGDTGSGLPVEAWAAAMDHANATVLHKVDRPLNVALRETYSDCSVHEGPTYVVLRRAGCEGRLDALRQALVRAQVAASAQH
ncbi:MAG TPA: hypothetical protein VFH47_06740, partial [Candidatus Thermoplasmatota archaeon]|nr:hypothetical protein [Candidatus Thermoplasmatota archaeon]